MLTKQAITYAQRCWQEALPSFGHLRSALEAQLAETDGEEKALLQLAYGTLPTSDVGSVPFSLLRSYARHALFLRENSPFCRDIPEDIFLHFVFYPRINTEDLSDCRPFFYKLIASRLEGLDADSAALELNRWCAEQMTYQSTNYRTESPLTAYRCGLGRCGEESTFAVSAFRSVGIPARQIYVPYWAHCDDNHAWVEVYTNGRWSFLGACEPEPVLNRGWFTDAASRAPLEYYRTFFDFASDGMGQDERIERQGVSLLFNVTHHYADTSLLRLHVTDDRGRPAANARIQIAVVNMAGFQPVLTNFTDENGSFQVHMGRTGIHVEAAKEGQFAMGDFTIGDHDCQITLVLTAHAALCGTQEVDYAPPVPCAKNKTVLTDAQQEENARVLEKCIARRAERFSRYYLPEYDAADPQWREIFRQAAYNAPELYRFYCAYSGAQRALAKQMLLAMEAKDYRDSSFEVLKGHFQAALPHAKAEHFAREVLNPRIRYEMLENWRSALQKAFSPQQQAAFAAQPLRFMEYIYRTYPNGCGRYYPALSMNPTVTLSVGHTDELGRRLLFVAGMRTFGVPARINPADHTAQYWRDGGYHSVNWGEEQQRSGVIHLLPQPGKRFVYANHYTLARWQEDHYQPLDYSEATGEVLEDPFRIPALPGEYRLLTVSRLPNGKQLCRISYFTLKAHSVAEVPLETRQTTPEEMLSSSALEPFRLFDGDGKILSSKALLSGCRILVYLEVGKEPTEHILNEILAAAPAMREERKQNFGLVFVLRNQRDLQNPTLAKVLDTIPGIQILYDDFKGTAAMLARKLFLEPGVWPLLILTDSTHRGYYGSAGYQVGIVELALSLSKCIRK